MSMRIDARVLTLQQWMSPSFPIGAFAYSHGIEWAIDQRMICNGSDLFDWVVDLVQFGSIRNDAILMALSCGLQDPRELNELALALCSSAERVVEAQTQGAAFLRVLSDVWGVELDELVLAVAMGQAVRILGIDPASAVAAYLHGYCSNLVSAAVRLVPLGQTVGQDILNRLTPILCAQTEFVMKASVNDLTSQTYLSDVAAMRHETMQPRIFKT